MPVLPRAGWLALGAIIAALLAGGGRFDLGLPAALVVVIGAGTLVGAVVALARRHMAGAALLLGLGAVALRAGIGLIAVPAAPTLPLPAGSGPWSAQVVDVSSPSGDQQRAFLQLSLAGTDEGEPPCRWLVYAWLPRHPSLVPGDRLSLRGTLDAPPERCPGLRRLPRRAGGRGHAQGRRIRASRGRTWCHGRGRTTPPGHRRGHRTRHPGA